MAGNQLKVVAIMPATPRQPISSRLTRRKELQAHFERLWLLDPEQFNPLRNCMQRERLERTHHLIKNHTTIQGKRAADLGCAAGVFTRRIRDEGAFVDAVDIAENALKELKKNDMANIEAKHDAMPETKLPDHAYDLVLCMEIIAELTKDDYRLFFSELARLVKLDGFVVCSTPIDFKTQDGVERLLELAQTEFDIIDAFPSYHALFIRLKGFFESFPKWLSFITKPILNKLKNSKWILLKLEKICECFRHNNGISHVIFIAKLRPLPKINPEEIPVERLHKKQIWE